MKKFTKMFVLAAAAMTMTAGVASAQKMSADIPFAFRAGKTLMMPGTYEVSYVGTAANFPLVRLYNRDNKKSAILGTVSSHYPGRIWEAKHPHQPTMAFSCTDKHCALTDVWAGTDRPVYEFPQVKTRGEDYHVTMVGMRPEKGE
jgi:hypothetical protein